MIPKYFMFICMTCPNLKFDSITALQLNHCIFKLDDWKSLKKKSQNGLITIIIIFCYVKMEGGGGGEMGEVWFKPQILSIIEGAGTTGLTAWIPPKEVCMTRKKNLQESWSSRDYD